MVGVDAERMSTGKAFDPPPFTEDSLADQFAKQEADQLRWVQGWRHWRVWDGTRWAEDSTLAVFHRVRLLCREQGRSAEDPNIRAKLAKSATIWAVEKLARADQRLAATVDQWDENPCALNTPAGIVDLRECRVLPHDPGAYLTKITAAAAETGCPKWKQFLDDVTAGDRELQDFLQRVAGYALTGSTPSTPYCSSTAPAATAKVYF